MGLESRHLGDMLHYLRVKFGGNRRSLSGSYFTLKMKKYSKIIIFWNLEGNISKTSGPRNMKFVDPLGDMLQYHHVKFGGNRRCLTSNVPKKRPITAIFGHVYLKFYTFWWHKDWNYLGHKGWAGLNFHTNLWICYGKMGGHYYCKQYF